MHGYLTEKEAGEERAVQKILLSSAFPFQTGPISRLKGGSRSFAFRAGRFVIRFPRTEDAHTSHRREAEISRLLQSSLPEGSRGKIPDLRIHVTGEYHFTFHPALDGEMLTPASYDDLAEPEKSRLADGLAAFFHEIHALPTDGIRTINDRFPTAKRVNWSETLEIFDANKARALILEQTDGRIDLNDFKMDPIGYDPVFCHNDLSGSNILTDGKGGPTGIIDFGNTEIAPRTNDFIPLYKVGRNLARRVLVSYNRLSNITVEQKETDRLFLNFAGGVLVREKRERKEHSEFVRGILSRFTEDARNKNGL